MRAEPTPDKRHEVSPTQHILSELDEPPMWAQVRDQYRAQLGGELPEKPPSKRHVETWREHLDRDQLEAAMRPVVRAMALDLARSLDLLRPVADPDFNQVPMDNLIQGDGTWMRPWSGVHWSTDDDDQPVVANSRARTPDSARIPEGVQAFTKDGQRVVGRGYVGFTARSDHRGERVVLDIAPIPNGGAEIDTTRRVLHDILGHSAGGVLAVAYDMALDGNDLVALMDRGVMPVVPVRAVDKAKLRIPDDLVRTRKRSRARNGRRAAEHETKTARATPIRRVAHPEDHDVRCEHVLWAYDGDVVEVIKTGDQPRARFLCPLTGRTRHSEHRKQRFVLTVEVPCPSGHFTVEGRVQGVTAAVEG